jgi:hypothetical protein
MSSTGFPPPLSFPKNLTTAVHKLPTDSQGRYKATIINSALDEFGKFPKKRDAAALAWNHNPADYTLKPRQHPAYFDKPFAQHTIWKGHDPNYMDYKPTKGTVDYWVDFANVWLGGGVFGEGFVQEEVMCCEFPELANAAAIDVVDRSSGLFTRDPQGDKVLGGSPTPLVIGPVYRTIEIDKKIYGAELAKFTGNIATMFKRLSSPAPPAAVHILAMAAPTLKASHYSPATPPDQWSLDVIHDLFNTFVAAFTLASAEAVKSGSRARINSGKIGCGDFGNDSDLVYVLQILAAEHVNVDLKLWGYTDGEANTAYNNIYNNVDRNGKPTISTLLDRVKAAKPKHP